MRAARAKDAALQADAAPFTGYAKSRIKLPPIRFGEDESLGERIARLRKLRGITQQELADRIGTIQVLISDYERDRLRVTAEMVVRIAAALEMTTDELLGLKKVQPNAKPSRKILRRLEQIDMLRPQQQATLLRTIDDTLPAWRGEVRRRGLSAPPRHTF